MSSIDIGLIGCGAGAKRYYVDALKKNRDSINNLFFVDKNLEQAQALCEEVGVGIACREHKDILNKVQGVIVVLPHFLHYPVSMDFLNAGVHVLCEKPLAETADQVKDMIEAARHHNVKLCVNNTRRMFPAHREVKRLIDNGEIGQIKSIKMTEGSVFGWASATGFYVDPKLSSRGILLDVGPHDIDLICWWLGEKPTLVSCMDDSFGGPESVVKIEAKTASATVDIFLNRLSDLDSRFMITGERGTIEGKPMDWNCLKVTPVDGSSSVKVLESPQKNYPQFVVPVVTNFISAIEGKEVPVISGQDVLNSIEFIEECYGKRERLFSPELSAVNKSTVTNKGITLVTGATGFVGGRVIEMLYLSKQRNVRAGIRQWSSAARLGRFPVEIVEMDLMNPQDIENALDGVTEIIHCAKGPGDVNAEGTKNLLTAALKKGIKHVVHLSTTEVYGDLSGPVTENSPLQYTGNEYNKTKIDSENICWDFISKGLPVTILRPSIIYGPFSNSWSVKFAKMFLSGEWGIIEHYGEGKCNLVYVDDLVQAIITVLNNDKSIGHAFNICGPEIVSWNNYFYRFNEAMGLPPLETITSSRAKMKSSLMEPVRMLGGFVRDHFMAPVKKVAETFTVADKLMRVIEHSLKTTPCPDELSLFSKDAIFSTDKSKELLDFVPLTNVDEGLEKSVSWLRSQGVC